MLSECNLAIKQSSGSQTRGASPFWTRASLVLSKALRSISVASSMEGDVATVTVAVLGVCSGAVARLDLELEADLTGSEIRRATGRGWMFWAAALWHKASVANTKKP